MSAVKRQRTTAKGQMLKSNNIYALYITYKAFFICSWAEPQQKNYGTGALLAYGTGYGNKQPVIYHAGRVQYQIAQHLTDTAKQL